MKQKEKKERKLTPAELRRKERFEAMKADLEREGYTAQELTLDVVKANVLAVVVMLPFVAALFIWYIWVNSDELMLGLSLPGLLLLLVVFIALAAVHELIHGLVWGSCAPSGFKAIEFGVIWSALTPYCTCGESLKKGQYILGAAMPTLVLGFGLGAVAVITGQSFLLYVALLMTFGGGGDFCIILKLLRYRPTGESVYCDHPYECGVVAFDKPARG